MDTIKLQKERRAYYAKNKERIMAKSAKYYAENKPKVLERIKSQYQENSIPKRKYAKKYAEENPNKLKKYSLTWRERHPEKRKFYTRNSQIRAYGISPEKYNEMLKKQGQRCAICNKPSLRRAMNIDHNHKTGKVRGLLCDGCNLSLGHLEREDFIEKAMQYLIKYI